MEDSEDTTDGEEEIEDVDHEDEMEDEASDDDAMKKMQSTLVLTLVWCLMMKKYLASL